MQIKPLKVGMKKSRTSLKVKFNIRKIKFELIKNECPVV